MKATLSCTCGAALLMTLMVTSGADQPDSPSAADRQTQNAKQSAEDGVVVHQGAVFLVKGGVAKRVDAAMVPAEQMLTRDGQLAPIPENVTGLGATGSARAIAGANSTATPNRPADATAQDGLVLQGGTVYLVRSGEAKRLDEATVPSGKMMTLGGVLVQAPEGIQGLSESAPTNGKTDTPK